VERLFFALDDKKHHCNFLVTANITWMFDVNSSDESQGLNMM
jgi:hypothetical protein